jgi:hypothetical protein
MNATSVWQNLNPLGQGKAFEQKCGWIPYCFVHGHSFIIPNVDHFKVKLQLIKQIYEQILNVTV